MIKPSRFTKLNKRVILIAVLAVVIALCLVCAASCDLFSSPKITRITAEYTGGDVEVGGTLSKDDVVVTAHYSNNTSKVVFVYILDYDFSTAGQREVTVTYGGEANGKKCTFNVNVIEPEPPEPVVTLKSITAVYNGENIKVGGSLDNADIVVTAYYSDESTKPVTGFTVSGFSSDTAGQKQVTLTYIEDGVTKTCTVTITVDEPEPPEPTVTLESITAVYSGANIKVGAALHDAAIVVTAYYSDESNKVVTNYSIGNFSSATAGTQQVEISYTEDGVTQTAFISVTVVEESHQVIANANLSIHFLELGNQSTGDCVYIKAGDIDILIDAGSTDGCGNTIHNYVSQYCTDGVLEYVVATHAHEDHIASFVGRDSNPGIMDRYECDTIIRYARANTTSQIRQKFENKCSEQVANGAKLYTALDCINNANGAQKVYDLTGDGNITMEVLNQRYYSENSSDENNYSVCVMINQKIDEQTTNHYLLTGDLEASGETSLVNLNPDLPEVVLFKGGHHGSYTASNEVLLQKIKPQYVCICCCAGNVEYLKQAPQNLDHSFPAQEMIDRVAKYTDKVYVTTLGFIRWDESKGKYFNDGYESMNGNITLSCINGEISLNCSNNNLKLKDTDWFKNNRTCPKEWLDDESD